MTAPAETPREQTATWKPAGIGWLAVAIFALVIVAGVLAVLAAWQLPPFTSAVAFTEDAYVDGHTTVISPEVSGYVWTVPIEDFQVVQSGQILVTIDPRTYQQQVAQAEARLASSQTSLSNNEQSLERARADVVAKAAAIAGAQAQLVRAAAELRRTRDLVRDGSVAVRENEANVAALSQARVNLGEAEAARRVAIASLQSVEVGAGSLEAGVKGAKAQVDAAQLRLDRTVIRAPLGGELSTVGVKVGQYVAEGTNLLYLVPPGRWVTANFKESATHDMRPGQRAWFTVDALGGAGCRAMSTGSPPPPIRSSACSSRTTRPETSPRSRSGSPCGS